MRRWRLAVIGHLWSLLACSAVALQSFVRQPSDQYVIIGQTVVLPCQVANPVGQVQWTRDEFGLGIIRDLPSYPRYQMIGDDHEGIFSLEVQRVELEDDAEFQCQVGAAAGAPGIRSRTARLTVLVPPEPPRIEQGSQLATTAGSVVQFQCESKGGKPPAEIEWYDGNRELIENKSETKESVMPDGKRFVVRSTLSLDVTAQHHGANITCRAHNPALGAPQSAALRLLVRFAPQVKLHVDKPHVMERRDATFTCDARANPEQADFQWFVNGELRPEETSAQLVLRNISRELNNATIVCKVSNAVGSGSDSRRLAVLYAPRFRQEPEDVAADAGHEVSLSCDIDANPEPKVTWVKRDCQSCQRRVGVGRRLRLRATRETVGRYECRASVDGFPEVSRQLMLFVRAQPEVTARPTQRGTVGDAVHVECLVASVPPPHTIVWYHQQSPIQTDTAPRYRIVQEPVEGGVRSVLVISKAVENDFGLYNCSFTNAYGSDSAVIILQKQRVLPLLVILIIVVGVIVVVAALILVIIICQRRNRRASDKPNGQMVCDKLTHEREPNSSGSDLKVEIRTTSLGSGQVITDRWDTNPAQVTGVSSRWDDRHDTLQQPMFENVANANGYPVFNQETLSPGAEDGYTPIAGYGRPPSGVGLHLYSGPSAAGAADGYGQYGSYGGYSGGSADNQAQYVVDNQLKPGTLATHV